MQSTLPSPYTRVHGVWRLPLPALFGQVWDTCRFCPPRGAQHRPLWLVWTRACSTMRRRLSTQTRARHRHRVRCRRGASVEWTPHGCSTKRRTLSARQGCLRALCPTPYAGRRGTLDISCAGHFSVSFFGGGGCQLATPGLGKVHDPISGPTQTPPLAPLPVSKSLRSSGGSKRNSRTRSST